MRWRNHKIITGLAVYSITGGLLSAACAAAGAVLPDVLEMGGLVKHRSVTHWPYPHLILALALFFWEWRNPSLLPYLLFFVAFGVVTHILLDCLSKSGVPVGIKPSNERRIALNLYKTFTVSEEITAAGLMVIFATTAYVRGFLNYQHLHLEVNLIAQLLGTLVGR